MWPIPLNTFLKQRKLCLKGEKTNYSYRRDPHLPPSASHPPFFSFPCFVEIQWLAESCCRMSTNILENEGFETQNFPQLEKEKSCSKPPFLRFKNCSNFPGCNCSSKMFGRKRKKKTPGTEAPNHSKSEIRMLQTLPISSWPRGVTHGSRERVHHRRLKRAFGGGELLFPKRVL